MINLYNGIRILCVVILSVTTHFSLAQIFSDDFSDGDFQNNPEWTGDIAKFQVNPEGELQLDDTTEGMSYLASELNSDISSEVIWEFNLRQSFSGSDNNNSRFYLMADAADVSYSGTGAPNINGYYLQFGEGGSDDTVELFRNDSNGTKTSIARATDGILSSSFDISVKVSRSQLGQWDLWVDLNAGEEYVLEDSGVDATYSNVSFISWVCKYTSSNSTKFFLDNLYYGEPQVDLELPTITDLTVVSSNQLEVEFSEPMNEASMAMAANYVVSGGVGQPLSASVTSNNLVSLNYGFNFPPSEELQLTVSGVEDMSANILEEISIPFTYYEIGSPTSGDLIFTEIFADPTPAVGLPDVEWVEIYNTSSETFDLSQIEFYNSSNLNSISNGLILPGEYMILSSSSGVLELDGFGSITSCDTFSALTNGQDSLTLVSQGEILDVVVYTDEWYQDDTKAEGGWSLERINPFAVCGGSQNWIASNGPLGGTPGTQNSTYDITEDDMPPSVVSVSAINETLIYLQANEALNAEILPDWFVLGNGLTVSEVVLISSNTGALLELNEPFEIGVPFILTVVELTDCEGNQNLEASDWEVLSGFVAEQGDVIITEIMADPTPEVGLPEVEYVELYNTTELYIDISSCELSGATFSESTILSPGEYQVILSEESIPGNFIFGDASGMIDWSSTFLTNSGKLLTLSNENGIIDEVEYDNTWYQDSEKEDGGWSLELINLNHPCSDAGNWRASEGVFGGSPGEQNSVYSDEEDVFPPVIELVYAISAAEIIVIFNEPIDSSTLENVSAVLSNQENAFVITTLDLRTLSIGFIAGLVEGLDYTLTVSGVSDCWGNQSEEISIPIGLPETPDAGDLIINEVLSNPRESTSDYVEIYNNSEKIISLQDWKLGKRDDDGNLASVNLITEDPISMFPGDYLLLTESKEEILENYPFSNTNSFFIMNLPSFSNSEGDVILIMPNDEISEEFHYDDSYHFGLISDLDGVSLERIDFDVDVNESTNWSSAAEDQNFGTPGYRNSQSIDEIVSSGEITVEPDVFSPDNDGHQDNLAISYEFERNNNVLNVTIFNKQGIEVRRLVSNEFIGQSGTFFWDGLNSEGEKLPVGIYIIYAEIFRLDGTVEGYKIPAVIAHL